MNALSAPSPATLAVTDLRVSYRAAGRRADALGGVSFEVRPGEIVAVVGESGSGKSTLAHALIGLLPDSAQIAHGRVELGDTRLDRLSERQWTRVRGAEIGFIPQDPGVALNPVQRVGRQVAESLRIHRLSAPDTERAAVLANLERAGVPDPGRVADCYPHELSGGYRQRVLTAIAFAAGPRFIIADEPTSALDVVVQRRVLDQIERLARSSGTGVVMITHDLAVAADRADRIVVMRGGRIVEQGPAEQVLDAPRHEYTGLLLASIPRLAADREQSPSARPLLTVRRLSKVFTVGGGRGAGALRAVDDVSFSVERGRTLALLGESGSGKSTTARMVTGLTEPTSGTVLFDGVALEGLGPRARRPFRRRIQLVAQNPYTALDPLMTIRQIIAEPLNAFREGTRRSRTARVKELLDQVALPCTVADRKPRELSGGQRQRVAIARALALRPDLVVFDEPVSALDVVIQAQILRLMAELQKDFALSYLFISHDLAVISQVSDTVAVMRQGAIVEQGPTAEVLTRPRDPYTASLLDAVPGKSRSRSR
ncbi:ABC transporter ATP-binding protein [Streptomyces sp. AgN23]|uniref:dipeptide ABC transporter ATP-binding protein n=1 Tax=Streptomyces sp. AgN23 TaxID=1188315 RepID=UPI001B3391F7|nr:ABC transporter ATP-binding protein [Streptomyces sp. AgN23]QTI90237.1 ABC transporter ATP-binding protein [Streptomyces sp. AgN23]